jgi:serine/threonine protein kinase
LIHHRLHADVKPDNILMVHGEFKLADFGFAKFKQRGEDVPRQPYEGGTETFGRRIPFTASPTECQRLIKMASRCP